MAAELYEYAGGSGWADSLLAFCAVSFQGARRLWLTGCGCGCGWAVCALQDDSRLPCIETLGAPAPASRGLRVDHAAPCCLAVHRYCANGPPDTPVFDAEKEAAKAVEGITGADVVLTTYTVGGGVVASGE